MVCTIENWKKMMVHTSMVSVGVRLFKSNNVVNVSLKFQMLISDTPIFFVEK